MRQRHKVASVQIALDSEHRVQLGDLKNGILALLGGWIAYFVIVQLFIQTLDRVTVPVVGMPLGALLVVQGSLVVFLSALILVARRLHGPKA